MKETPLLLKAPLVNATLGGQKIVTRRLPKSEPPDDSPVTVGMFSPTFIDTQCEDYPGDEVYGAYTDDWGLPCPFGQPGDRLWVRETWQAWAEFDDVKPSDLPHDSRINYLANGNRWDSKTRVSIHMPRWASRINLRITSIDFALIQSMTAQDAIDEGVTPGDCRRLNIGALSVFKRLWDSIYCDKPFGDNPWVWVIGFEVE